MKKILIAALMVTVTGSVFAKGLYNLALAKKVYTKYSSSFSQIDGISSMVVTTCVAETPLSLHKYNIPDIFPEACIQLTFTDEESLNKARAKYSERFRLEGALVYVGNISESGAEPGISIHN